MITVNKKIGTHRVTFTPSFFRRAYEQYKNGYHRELIAMMKEVEIDSLVSGCLQGRKAGYQRELNIEPYDREDARDAERAEFYKEVFSRLKVRSLFKAIMQARRYRYSVIDFDWEVIDGRQVPVAFTAFDQKYFAYDVKGDGRLKIDFNRELKEIPPEALVCESDETPFMLPVLRDYILKEFGLQAWASFIETFGEGLIIGYYPPNADESMRRELDNAVNTIAASSRGTAPKGTEIEIKESNKSTGDHQKFTEACDTGIAISILGHANAVRQSGGLHVGENQAPFKPMQFISIDDLYFVDEQLDELVKNIHERNFGDSRYPNVVTSKPDQLGMKERRENLKLAWEMGFGISPDDVRKLGVDIDPEEERKYKTDPFTYNV